QFKPALAALAVEKLSPITDEINRMMADPAEVDRILGDGAARADAIAAPVLKEVYETVGLIQSV
ncbi:MAG: tryptophan--tRNA ligase, partial [Pseudomonadota bacterium]